MMFPWENTDAIREVKNKCEKLYGLADDVDELQTVIEDFKKADFDDQTSHAEWLIRYLRDNTQTFEMLNGKLDFILKCIHHETQMLASLFDENGDLKPQDVDFEHEISRITPS